MTLLLIVVIPLAFLYSGQQFLQAGKENQERLEKERIGLFHDLFASMLTATDFDTSTAQNEMERVATLNPDIKDFRIVKEEGSELVVDASLDAEEVGNKVAKPDAYRIANAQPGESFIIPTVENTIRHWQSTRLVLSENNERYYIYTKTSLERVDSLFAERIKEAYLWLLGILAVILILLLRHVRLIDYAYLYRETKKANEMKDLFTNMIAHELRTPLTSIRGYASLIRQKDSATDEIKGFAERIEESSGRLVLIVNDLLDVARIQSGKLSIQKERVELSKLFVSVIEAQTMHAKEKSITLTPPSVPSDLYISGDEKRLYQAFTNLVSNSIKYTKAGTISLEVTEREDRVEVRVKDTGMGMSAEDQKKLFAPFFRIENTETQKVTGTGLGMWITKQLIELMGGSIAVESIKGVGTHVVVTLPK